MSISRFNHLALQPARAIEASMIKYLRPMLSKLLSLLFFKEFSLRPNHILGSCFDLLGEGRVVMGEHIIPDLTHTTGYLVAVGEVLT